jgi:serine/threonine protein kinase
MTNWTLNPEYAVGSTSAAFSSLDAVFALEGKTITRDVLSEVLRVQVGTRRYYVKLYHGAGKNLRRFIGRPRVQSEWRNLLLFKSWGIPVATVVGYGMERRGGIFHRGALITEELYDTEDLAQLAEVGDARLRNPSWVGRVLRQVARATREMHKRRFTHNDLKWRNILVDGQRLPSIYLIDCPGGTFWWGPFLERRKIKDLACLDKIGKYQLSRTQRLRFYLTYNGRDRLRQEDRARIGKIVHYFEGRE